MSSRNRERRKISKEKTQKHVYPEYPGEIEALMAALTQVTFKNTFNHEFMLQGPR